MELKQINKVFDNINTKRGIPEEIQKKLMNGNAQFIIDISNYLNVQSYSICSVAIQICNYFFTQKSYFNYDRFLVASTCMLLAFKIRDKDSAQRFKYLIEIHHKIVSQFDQKTELNDQYISYMKEKICILENKVIKAIEYDFSIDSPFDYIKPLSQKFITQQYEEKVFYISKVLLLDSYRTAAPLCFSALTLAVSSILVSTSYFDYEPYIEVPQKLLSEFNTEGLDEDQQFIKWIELISSTYNQKLQIQDIKDSMLLLTELFYSNFLQNDKSDKNKKSKHKKDITIHYDNTIQNNEITNMEQNTQEENQINQELNQNQEKQNENNIEQEYKLL